MQQLNYRSALLWLIPLLLVPSGCAALIYQVTWVRLLGLSMGSTSAAVSTVLTAFFCGMAIGSYFADKISQGKFSDLRIFALVEIIIGLSGLILVPVLLNLDYGMAMLGSSGSFLLVKFATSLILLAIPTICMGATFPLLAAALIQQQDKMNSELGKLYTLNTSGAVIGALLSAFILIPLLGIDGAVYVASGLNLSVAVSGFILWKKLQHHNVTTNLDEPTASSTNVSDSHTVSDNHKTMHFYVAIILFCTGFVSIANEVAWTKYLAIFTGATIYGFAAILGIFLTGIALGAWATKRYVKQSGVSISKVIWVLLILASSLLLARVGLAQLPALLDYSNHLTALGESRQIGRYLVVFVILFPATFLFGALFPVSLSLYCEQVVNIPKRIGHAYAINTAGSILGSIAAGFWLIPQFGTDTLLSATIIIILAIAILFINKSKQPKLIVFTIAGLIIAGTWQLPHLDYAKLIIANPYRHDSESSSKKTPKLLFLEEGKAGVISLVTYDDIKAKLQNNAIQESYVALKDGLNPPFSEMLLGLLPYLLHPDPSSAFVVGFGGGNTVQALADTTLKTIRVTELEPAVISAVASISDGEIPLLQDPRIKLQINDARNTLLVENTRYDLIVSQPSHPWLAGAGNLFTKEFFKIVAESLNDKGIYAQWVNLFNMDATTLGSIFQAFYQVFPHGFTVANTSSGDLILLGSDQPIVFDYNIIEKRMKIPAIKKSFAIVEVKRPEHLLWYFSLSREEALTAANGVQANSDTRILSEVRLAGMSVDPKGEDSPYNLLRSHYHLDVLNYLKPQKSAQILYLAGRYFYSYDSATRTQQAISQLETVDPTLATLLKKNWHTWRENKE